LVSPKTRPLSAWHPEDVKAAIRKRGVTLTDLSLKHDFSEAYLRNALRRPLREAEVIIANFLGLKPEQIWPDRYDANGNPDYVGWRQRRKAKTMHDAAKARAA
jgi:Ner family transcriptional regulator